MFKRVAFAALISTFLFTSSTSKAETQKVFYPRPETEFDERTGFPLTLLQLIFDRIQNGEKYDLRQTPIAMPRGRALMLLQRDVVVDIFWSMTSIEREEVLLPIKFPIYNGMMGWRVMLIQKDAQQNFTPEISLSQLRKLVAIQAHDWADMKVLESNNFSVQGAVAYEELFSMVGKGRVDYFPRSVVEVLSEQTYIEKYNLAVEQHFLLKYPAAMYFFVNKENLELAKDIEIGLQRARQDGSYELLFTSIHELPLSELNLSQRKVIELQNPYFPTAD